MNDDILAGLYEILVEANILAIRGEDHLRLLYGTMGYYSDLYVKTEDGNFVLAEETHTVINARIQHVRVTRFPMADPRSLDKLIAAALQELTTIEESKGVRHRRRSK